MSTYSRPERCQAIISGFAVDAHRQGGITVNSAKKLWPREVKSLA